MKRSSLKSGLASASVIVMVLSAGVVQSAAAPDHSPVMTDTELAGVRGGYLSSNGLTFGFGATVTTFIDGSLALESRLTVTDAGVLRSQTAGTPLGAAALSPAASATLSGPSGQGVVIAGDGGVSTVIHNLTDSQILGVVLNTASNRMITQNTAVTITLPAFNQLQQNAAAQQLSASLLSAVGVGAVGAIRH